MLDTDLKLKLLRELIACDCDLFYWKYDNSGKIM